MYSVFIAQSLDGYIADKNGKIDWLTSFPNPNNDDFGYNDFMENIDAIIMGSSTFKTVEGFESWPYADKKVVVASKSIKECKKFKEYDLEFSSKSPLEIKEYLDSIGKTKVYVDGGKLITSFLQNNLIDEITLFTLPILLGGGAKLFGEISEIKNFGLISGVSFSNGIINSKYKSLV